MAHKDSSTQREEPTILIRTKLNRPRLGGDLVSRPRLLTRLECDPQRKLTLVSAPAGYGKTTLLVQWLEDCPHPSAWLSLDEGDSDPAVFLSYFIAAIRTVVPDACPTAGALLRAPQPPPLDHMATVLTNELVEVYEPLTLVLDDYHYIRDLSVHGLLNRILRYLPEQVHLVIASRTDPRLELDRLRAGRQMLELRANDLRFSIEEAQAFLESELGRELAPETVALLEQRTEGWIAGLHLSALWLHRTEDYAPILDGFQGDSARFVTEYLIIEVLAHQPAEVQDFLLRTSILDRFCAPLCDVLLDERRMTNDIGDTRIRSRTGDEAPLPTVHSLSSSIVTPSSHSQDILAELDRTNLFLIPLDDEHGWYRYHHLFRVVLRQRLHTEMRPDEVRTLHQRASRWLAGKDHLEEALRHALAADDVEAAISVVEENSQDLLNRLERHTLERWLAMLPEEAVGEHPRLLVVQGWLLYRQWRLRALDAVLDAAEACLSAGGPPTTSEEQAIWGQIYTLRSATAYMVHNDFQRSRASGERALDRLPTAERGARSVALMFRSVAQQGLGEKDTAIRHLQEAIDAPAHLAPSKIQALLGLAFVNYLAADLYQMGQATDRFLALAAELKQSNAITAANWLSGLLRYEWNDLSAAAEHFSELAEQRYGSNFAAILNSQLGLARIHQVRGELDKAQGLIDDLRGESMRLDNTDLLPPVDALQAYQWLLRGDVALALGWARSFDSVQLEESVVWFEAPSQIWARILTAYGTVAEVKTTERDLREKLNVAVARHNTRRVIQILAHLALAYDRLGQTDDALTSLERAVALAQPGGFIRSFVDPGPALRPLLQRLSPQSVAREYLSQVLAAFDTVPQVESPPRAMLAPREARTIYLLTNREEEILHLMGEGLTNQEIADELVISLYTVKRHATNIYNKLSVNSRRQAVLTAKRLGVLPSN